MGFIDEIAQSIQSLGAGLTGAIGGFTNIVVNYIFIPLILVAFLIFFFAVQFYLIKFYIFVFKIVKENLPFVWNFLKNQFLHTKDIGDLNKGTTIND